MLTKHEQKQLPKIVNNNSHLFLILPNGSFYVWGGDQTKDSPATLKLKEFLIKIEFISNYAYHFRAYILGKNQKLYACKHKTPFYPIQNDNKKLKLKEVPNIKNVESIKILTSPYDAFFKTKGGELFISTTKDKTPKLFYKNPDNDIQEIAAGDSHLVCLTQNYLALCYGSNEYGQLGLGDKIPVSPLSKLTITKNNEILKITRIACGHDHTLFLTKDKSNKHQVYGCGYNPFGQLGLDNFKNQYYPVCINFFDVKNIIIIDVSAGKHRSFFLSNKHQVYACGDNGNGELGIGNFKLAKIPTLVQIPGNKVRRAIPIDRTTFFICATKEKFEFYSVGSNDFHYLALKNTGITEDKNTPTKFFETKNFRKKQQQRIKDKKEEQPYNLDEGDKNKTMECLI